MPERNSILEHITAKVMDSAYADARRIGHTASDAIGFAESAKRFILELQEYTYKPIEQVGSGMRKIGNIVRHKSVRHELNERQIAALRAVISGYRHIDRRDGLSLLVLGLVYHTPRGFFATEAGRIFADDDAFFDIGIPV